MKILSLNALDGELREELKDFLNSLLNNTDVFCFQETLGQNIETLLSEIFSPAKYWTISTEKTTDGHGQYNLFTAVKRPLQVSDSQTLLSATDAEVGQALAITVLADGQSFTIVNVHGVPFPGDKLDNAGRLQQSDTIIRWLDEHSASPTVVCGDFNLLPETQSVNMFTRAGYQNLIADYKIPTTRNELAWRNWPNNIQLYADYTFTSGNLKIVSFNVPDITVSDHLPMITVVET